MQATHELPHETWSEYFEAVSRELVNAQMSIEIVGLPGEESTGSHRVALAALVYNKCDDVFEVSAEQSAPRRPRLVRRRVQHPERVVVDTWTVLAPMTIAVDGRDGIRTLIRIDREPELAR